MMEKQSVQIQLVFFDMVSMIPEDHLLRRIKNCVNPGRYAGKCFP